jgi:succinyl-diaminopimelate desuccinylase
VSNSEPTITLDLDGLDDRDLRLVEFARRMVATPSLPGQEAQVSELVAAELERLGYRDVEIDAVGNVIGWFGHGPPRLMFNGHIDHVPTDGMEDPHGAQIVDAAVYGGEGAAIRGRGSCDMKANVAAGAYAAIHLDPEGLQGSYLFVADVQEETDSPVGIPNLLEQGLRADFGLSGESTGLRLSLGHRGKVQFDLTVAGRSSHASTPSIGVNAVYQAVPYLRALEELATALPDDPLFGPATVTVTAISSTPDGDMAVVPNSCRIRIDRRYVRGETPETVQRQLEDLVAEVGSSTGSTAALERVNVYPLMEIDPEHPLVREGEAAITAVTGAPVDQAAWRFGVNATFMSAAGIPTIGIGPGNEDWAHTREEHVPVAELIAASKIYAELVKRLCG